MLVNCQVQGVGSSAAMHPRLHSEASCAPIATAAAKLQLELFGWQDEREAAGMLVRAFASDPLMQAICGGPAAPQPEKMWWSFRLSLRAHCLSPHRGWVLRTASRRIVGLVLVSYPGAQLYARPDTWFSLRSLWHIGWATTQRAVEAARCVARHLPRRPFLYVRTLGVDPSFHQRGLGSALLAHALAAVPTASAYLETAREANLRFYSRHGFRCIGTFSCLGVPVWQLWRSTEEICSNAVAGSEPLG